MQTGSPNQRPSVARALELALRDVLPERNSSARVPTGPDTATPRVAPAYFAPGDYADERGWWAKQLARPA